MIRVMAWVMFAACLCMVYSEANRVRKFVYGVAAAGALAVGVLA